MDPKRQQLNILVIGSRLEPSTALWRGLAATGARVDVADFYRRVPARPLGTVAGEHLVAPPAQQPLRFVEEVADIVRRRDIDLVVPAFEEGFYLSCYAAMIPATVFAPAFATIERLHNKLRFLDICRDLDLPAPDSIAASSREDLRAAVGQFDAFIAKPAFSRGGRHFTNRGHRAGAMSIDDCAPTPGHPWLVQRYVDGVDACSFSVVRDGRIVLHSVYAPSESIDDGRAIEIASIDDFGSLAAASKIAAAVDYNGFLSLDYRRTPEGFVMIECNPRVTAGILLAPDVWIGDAIRGAAAAVRLVPAGHRSRYDGQLGSITRGSTRTIIDGLTRLVAWNGGPMPVMPVPDAKREF